MTNQELKQYMKKRKIYQWRVAERLGIQETALSRKFRHEIGERDKKNIIAVIDELYAQDHKEKNEYISSLIKTSQDDIFDELCKELEI